MVSTRSRVKFTSVAGQSRLSQLAAIEEGVAMGDETLIEPVEQEEGQEQEQEVVSLGNDDADEQQEEIGNGYAPLPDQLTRHSSQSQSPSQYNPGDSDSSVTDDEGVPTAEEFLTMSLAGEDMNTNEVTATQMAGAGLLLGFAANDTNDTTNDMTNPKEDRALRRRQEAQQKKDANHDQMRQSIVTSNVANRVHRDIAFGEDTEPPSAFVIPAAPVRPQQSHPPQQPRTPQQEPIPLAPPAPVHVVPHANPYNQGRIGKRNWKMDPPPRPVADTVGAPSVAAQVLELHKEHGYEGMSQQEQDLIQNTKRGKNTAETERRKVANEKRFFEVLKDHGGPAFAPLLLKVPVKYAGYSTVPEKIDYEFFNACGYTREEDARQVVNKASIVFALSVRKKKGRDGTAGQPFEPNTLEQFFRNVYCYWKAKGIWFDFDKDFNGPGELNGVVQEYWASNLKKDKKYASNKEKRRIKENVLHLVCQAVDKGLININDRWDLLRGAHFNCGLFMCFRGKKDHIATRKDYIRRGVYQDDFEDDLEKGIAGKVWVGMYCPWNKTNPLKFGNTTLPPETERIQTMRDYLGELSYNPVAWFDKYEMHLHPDAVGYYAYPYTKEESAIENARLKQRDIDWNREHPESPRVIQEYDVWYKPSNPNIKFHEGNVGHNKHCTFIQEFCKQIGVQDAEKVASGHALRAKACTVLKGQGVDPHAVARQMRHKSIDTQKHYTETTLGMRASVMNGLVAGVKRRNPIEEDGRKPAARPRVGLESDIENVTPHVQKHRPSALNTQEREELQQLRLQNDPDWLELERLRRLRNAPVAAAGGHHHDPRCVIPMGPSPPPVRPPVPPMRPPAQYAPMYDEFCGMPPPRRPSYSD
eukprot:Sro3890_g351730.1 n/a (867) ;mRNA; r:671-3273